MSKGESESISQSEKEDPVIQDELKELVQPGLDPKSSSGSQDVIANYETFNDEPYPTRPDAEVMENIESEERKREGEWRCLNCFEKLRGENDRQNFFIKVMMILTFQFLLTVCIITSVWLAQDVKDYLEDHKWVAYTVMGVCAVCLLVML